MTHSVHKAVLTPSLKKPITNLEEGKAWIDELAENGWLFHFEDSPESIGNTVDGEWVDLFDVLDVDLVRERVDQLYALDWTPAGQECPIGYALTKLEPPESMNQ